MGTPVVTVASGGIAVTEVTNGLPVDESIAGGMAVTIVETGGLGVSYGTGGDAPAPGVTLTFAEEFNSPLSLRTGGPTEAGYAAGSGKFTPRIYNIETAKGFSLDGNGEYQFYPDPAYAWSNGFTPYAVADSMLRIRAQKTSQLGFAGGEIPDKPGSGAPYPYCSGFLTTRDSFIQRGGWWQFRAKVPVGNASWPALWLLSKEVYQPPEIDLVEINGNAPDDVNMNVHGDGTYMGATFDLGEAVSDDYHLFAVNVTSTHVYFYVDGTLRHTVDIREQPLFNEQYQWYLILNLAIGSNIPGWIPAPDGSTPDIMDLMVDWVRAWQAPGPTALYLTYASCDDTVAIGTTVSTLSAETFGASSGVTFSIVSDAQGAFTIVGNELRTAEAMSAAILPYHLVLRATDSAGRTWDRTVWFIVLQSVPTGPNILTSNSINDASWTKENSTSSTGFLGPDGVTSNAQRLLETATTAEHPAVALSIVKPARIITYRCSGKFKYLGRDIVRLAFFNGAFSAGYSVFFNIATGTIDPVRGGSGGFSAANLAIHAEGNGFFHVSVDITTDAGAGLVFSIEPAINVTTLSYLGDVTKGLYAFDVYAEDKTGNAFTSGDVTNAYWTKEQISASGGHAGPTSALNAQRLLETAVTNQHDVVASVAKAATVKTYRFSAEVKILGRDYVRLSVFNGAYSAGWSVFFNIATGAVGSNGGSGFSLANAAITALANGFYHITADFTTNASSGANFQILTAVNEATISYLGDITKGVYCQALYAQDIT